VIVTMFVIMIMVMIVTVIMIVPVFSGRGRGFVRVAHWALPLTLAGGKPVEFKRSNGTVC
jgi:hypothetical protein